MSGHDIIVIGTSAGGVEALTYLVKRLPSDLNSAVFIVLHVSSHGNSVLPRILSRAGNLPAHHVKDGEAIVPQRIYIAPPDYHLLLKPGYVHLSRGPRENSHRPAIDPLFRSAARSYGARLVGVVLTGVLDDGTAGLQAVKMRGGVAVVQDPENALYSGMPRNAIENVKNIDYVVPLAKIPSLLVKLANTPVREGEKAVSDQMEFETDIAELDITALNKDDRPGKLASFGCPECGGTLWELQQGELLRFRCRIGHAYSVESLLAEQSDALENALWFALRALEEKASLAERIAQKMRDRHQDLSAERLDQEAQDAFQRATIIREALLSGDGTSETDIIPVSGEEKPINET